MAIELSKTRYCPVIGMLGKVAEVTTHYEIEEETELRPVREGEDKELSLGRTVSE